MPDFGLDPRGELRLQVGEVSFELAVNDDGVTVSWRRPDGRRTKSAPAKLRESHSDQIAELKALAKDVKETLAVQRRRLETLLRADREWDLPAWQVRYMEHGLVGALAGRLVWRFANESGERSGIWVDGGLSDPHGEALLLHGEQTRVRLWHPIGARDGDVDAWRAELAARGITQPFSQVEREIFVPTAAERLAASVGRFAHRPLRQHQLAAICKEREWEYELRSAVFDSSDSPSLTLSEWDLTAIFALDDKPNSATSERSILLEVRSGDVHFRDAGDECPVAPADVPLIVFSEVMRDVALFASAAGTSA